jgi:RNA-binding protein
MNPSKRFSLPWLKIPLLGCVRETVFPTRDKRLACQLAQVNLASRPSFRYPAGMVTLTNRELREFKGRAQLLQPVARVGKSGLTTAVLASIEQALAARELIKVRFDAERDERDILAGNLAAATGAALIWQVGKVAVFYRPKPKHSSST